jgi:amino acid transporter
MLTRIKWLLIGSPLATYHLEHKRLNKIRALAALSPNALSSFAYANEEIFLGLVVAGAAGLALSLPLGLIIGGLLIIVAVSYFETIHGYPSGGGSYVVAQENLGLVPGLVAGAALLIDYVMCAAVCVTAGVAAIASAFPILWPYEVHLSLLLLGILMLANLRGLRETGTLMAIPVYAFLAAYLPMIALGIVRSILEGPGSLAAAPPPAEQPLSLPLILGTFAMGCTALTGIEAVSNGVPAFERPETKNAGRTLVIMALLMGVLFVGSIALISYLAVVASSQETITSALARRVLGSGPAYLLVEAGTMAILALAANTSFAGFPRVASVMARDGFLPRQLGRMGGRLVFTNGILLVGGIAGGLIMLFRGSTHTLMPLFAVGALLAFTLSQAGMVVHWARERGRGWWFKAALNGLGAVVTGVAVAIVFLTKFLPSAWIVALLIPLLVVLSLKIHAHYETVAQVMALEGPSLVVGTPARLPANLPLHPRVVVPVSDVHSGTYDVVRFARSISSNVMAVHIEVERGTGERIMEEWQRRWRDVPLVVIPSPYRSVVEPLLEFLDAVDALYSDGQLAVLVLPELVPDAWWKGILHSPTAWRIRVEALSRRRHSETRRTIIRLPLHLEG